MFYTMLKIITRKSPLALAQTKYVQKKLYCINPKLKIQLIPIQTKGDIIFKKFKKNYIDTKRLFVEELEIALLQNKADIAIHSTKDMPIQMHPKLILSGICKRENPLDAFVSNKYQTLQELPQGAIIGTSSSRRKCQLLFLRPDLLITPIRGNVETRLKKLDQGKYDAIILAVAGLKRLKLKCRINEIISPTILLPSCGQGSIGIQSKLDDKKINFLIKKINHKKSYLRTLAERSFCKKIGSSCQFPIGSFAILKKNKLFLRGLVGSPNGENIIKGEKIGNFFEAKKIGKHLAKEILNKGAKKIVDNFLKTKKKSQ
ncbi:hydroxymethylbilane synthase [Buchnera aphidicola (Kurisakia onigurumii)]|uniref:hydroxymethylbilane synthase n=1 Tax=Buchnera aphidicola TaxID=9 RepID=UPI0031B682FE